MVTGSRLFVYDVYSCLHTDKIKISDHFSTLGAPGGHYGYAGLLNDQCPYGAMGA